MTDDERTARIGRNESLFREVNDNIEGLNRGLAAVSDGLMHIVCECGDQLCVQQLSVTPEVYEQVRSDPALFLVVPGHEKRSTERVVDAQDRYHIVRKEGPVAERVAEETDPRG